MSPGLLKRILELDFKNEKMTFACCLLNFLAEGMIILLFR